MLSFNYLVTHLHFYERDDFHIFHRNVNIIFIMLGSGCELQVG